MKSAWTIKWFSPVAFNKIDRPRNVAIGADAGPCGGSESTPSFFGLVQVIMISLYGFRFPVNMPIVAEAGPVCSRCDLVYKVMCPEIFSVDVMKVLSYEVKVF
jgi:hypothetical protein